MISPKSAITAIDFFFFLATNVVASLFFNSQDKASLCSYNRKLEILCGLRQQDLFLTQIVGFQVPGCLAWRTLDHQVNTLALMRVSFAHS